LSVQMSMKIRVLFFGATASVIGAREIEKVTLDNSSPADVISELKTEHPGLSSLKLLIALNEEYVRPDVRMNDGDELAIFTQVSGG